MPPKKKVVTELIPTEEDYNQLTDAEHVLKRPDMYMGDIKIKDNVPTWVMNEDNEIEKIELKISNSLLHIFSEMMTNASDNAPRSRVYKFDVGEIKVNVDGNKITIENNGCPIPLGKKDGLYVPELIFGEFRTGINFGDVTENEKTKIRKGAGKNGLGAKIANVYSNIFKIEVYNAVQHKSYKQQWENNMTKKSEPVLQDYQGGVNSVKIYYELDFARFGYDKNYNYSEEIVNAMRFIASNNAISQHVPVLFNGKYLPKTVDELKNSWLKMMKVKEANTQNQNKEEEKEEEGKEEGKGEGKEEGKEEEGKEEGEEKKKEDDELKSLYHIEWPKGTKMIGRGKTARVADPNVLPEVEIYLFDKIDNVDALTFSTTSGAINYAGGVHENEVWNNLSKIFDGKVKNLTRQFLKANLPKHLSLILVYRAENPDFRDQAKTYLTNPQPTVVFSDEDKKNLVDWHIIEYFQEIQNIQEMLQMKKTDGRKKPTVTVKTLTDAGYAGKANAHLTSLCYCEGMSATGYPKKVRGFIPNGTNLYGYIYGKGKPINSENITNQKLVANDAYKNLKKALGLEEGVDYEKADVRAKLRYGELLVMADADTDGSHIIGLLLLMLYKRFPSLIKAGFVKVWCTPIIRVSKGKIKVKFYTEGEYERWRGNTPNYQTWEHSYFKGLATSSDEEIKEDVGDPHKVTIQWDEYTEDYLNLAFTKGYEDLRKKWIQMYEPKEFDIRQKKTMTISEFVSYQLILFSIYDTGRSLPHSMDGLKISQRKCIEGMFRIWGAEASKEGAKKKKVDKIGNLVNDHTNHAHGVNSLYGAVQNMAQDYPGSNNLPIFLQKSQVGTRDMMGKDAGSERYTDLVPNPIIRRSLIRPEDDIILEYLIIEGKKCEPKFFLEVLPLLLINGSEGIGTGSAAKWTNYNLFDLADNAIRFIDDKPRKKLTPQYQGFIGSVKITEEKEKPKPLKHDLNLCYHQISKSPIVRADKYEVVLVEGKVEGNSKMARITEIPIDISIDKYKKYLQELVEDKTIKGMDNSSDANNPDFTIYGHLSPIPENLKLISRIKLSNLVALNDRGLAERYNTVNEYFEWWCAERLAFYEKRKKAMVLHKQEEIDKLDKNIAFLEAYLQKKIKIDNQEEESIKEQMEKLGFEFELLNSTNLGQLSKTRFEALKAKRAGEQQKLDDYKNTPAKEIWRREIEELKKDYTQWLKKTNKLVNRKPSLQVTEQPKGKSRAPRGSGKPVGKKAPVQKKTTESKKTVTKK